MSPVMLGAALVVALTFAVGIAALRKPPVDSPPAAHPERSRRPCAGMRGAMLRGLTLALVLVPLALLDARGAIHGVASMVAIATVCCGVVAAGLLEHAGARRDEPVVALMIGSLAALTVPIALAQAIYANAVVRGGADQALAMVTRLIIHPDAGLAAHRRIRSGRAQDDALLIIVPLTLLAPLPGLMLLEIVYAVARVVDGWLGRRVDT